MYHFLGSSDIFARLADILCHHHDLHPSTGTDEVPNSTSQRAGVKPASRDEIPGYSCS
jgi:hypothetical protein